MKASAKAVPAKTRPREPQIAKLTFEVEYKPPKRKHVTIKVLGSGKQLGSWMARRKNHTLEYDDSVANDLFTSHPAPLELDLNDYPQNHIEYRYFAWDEDADKEIEIEDTQVPRKLVLTPNMVGKTHMIKDAMFGDLTRGRIVREINTANKNPYATLEEDYLEEDDEL